MKAVRYVVGAISFLIVWIGVAVVIGFAISLMFPPTDGRFGVGIGTDLRNLPGTILGILAGIHSFRASVRERKPPKTPEA